MTAGISDAVTVLCVDDDRAFLELETELLTRRADAIQPVTAHSAEDALDVLDERDVDCVVSDYEMPGMDGLELLDAVRDKHPDLPFVLFTGRGSEEIASDAISAGVTDYLQKDTGTDQYEVLANRVRAAVARVRESSQRERAEQWYRQLFEQRLVGVGISQDGDFVQANQRLADIFGRERADVIGSPVESLVAPEDHERVHDALFRRLTGGVDSVRYVVTGQRPDGERVDVEVNGGRVDYRGEPAILGMMDEVDLVDVDPTASASLADAAHSAYREFDAGRDATLHVDADATIPVDESFLTQFFADVVEQTVGRDPEDCEVTVAPTEAGFRVRVSSPRLVDALSGDLYTGSRPRPDPVSGAVTKRGWGVFITAVDDTTIEYDLERDERAERGEKSDEQA